MKRAQGPGVSPETPEIVRVVFFLVWQGVNNVPVQWLLPQAELLSWLEQTAADGASQCWWILPTMTAACLHTNAAARESEELHLAPSPSSKSQGISALPKRNPPR